jgi:two-component system sensor histidine kinase KdpD
MSRDEPVVESRPNPTGFLSGPRGGRKLLGFVAAIGGAATVTLALLPHRGTLTPVSIIMAYQVIVVAATVVGGLWPGIAASVAGFVAFNYFFLPPYGTFVVARPEHVVVLFIFLGLSIVIATLIGHSQERARLAESKQAELQAIAALSAMLVAQGARTGRSARTLERVVGQFGFTSGWLLVRGEGSELRQEAVVGDRSSPGTSERTTRVPLEVGGRELGAIVLEGERAPLSPAEERVLRAFADQLALWLESKRLEQAASAAEVYRKTEELRRALLAAVSHELKSPVASIKTSITDALEEDVETDPVILHEILDDVRRETERLELLITNLLDMSRIESGMLVAKTQPVDLVEVAAHCIEHLATTSDVPVRWEVPDPAIAVDADPVLVERVITNLLENAAKASSGNGGAAAVIDLLAERDGKQVTVRVRDRGPGVTGEVQEMLFHPFYELKSRSPRLGTGLGLAICKGFVTAMGGSIWVEDTPGGGATFAFNLPARTWQ